MFVFSCVCEALKAAPMDGRATLAMARGKLATAATMMSEARIMPAFSGAPAVDSPLDIGDDTEIALLVMDSTFAE